MSQAGHRVLRGTANALGQDQTVAGALFDIVVRRYLSDRHWRGHRGQQSRGDQLRGRAVGRTARTGHRHVDVRGVLRSAQTVRRPFKRQTKTTAPPVHRHRFRVHVVHSVGSGRVECLF